MRYEILNTKLLLLGTLVLLLSNCAKDSSTPLSTIAIPQLLTELPTVLEETSGLIKRDDRLLSHNDSDGGAKLFQVSEHSATMEKEWMIMGAENVDWEDLAMDEQHVYIADIGNNFGLRPHLDVYQLRLEDMEKDSLMAQRIRYTYPDQIDFTSRPDHNFDGEALIAFGDSLYIFTKNRQDRQTNLYALPKQPGEHKARFYRTFNTDGLITAATVEESLGILCLLGYNRAHESAPFEPFLWLFYDFPSTDFFAGAQLRLELDIEEQVEGICFSGDRQLLISSEAKNGQSAHLYQLDVSDWIP
ncbi:MAG: hypothetical protein AAGG75_10990 [Bacteroidota bacterium]